MTHLLFVSLAVFFGYESPSKGVEVAVREVSWVGWTGSGRQAAAAVEVVEVEGGLGGEKREPVQFMQNQDCDGNIPPKNRLGWGGVEPAWREVT